MVTLSAELTADRAILRRDEFEHLLELARRTEQVVVNVGQENPGDNLSRLALKGRAFDFWKERGEDIYSALDGEGI